MSTQRKSRRSVNPILHIWASNLSFFILLLKLKWVGFISHFMVLYFRNVDLDLPKISELFWTPVPSRYGDENLTSWKNHLVHLWPTSFIRANYVQLPQQNFSRTPLVVCMLSDCHLCYHGHFSMSDSHEGSKSEALQGQHRTGTHAPDDSQPISNWRLTVISLFRSFTACWSVLVEYFIITLSGSSFFFGKASMVSCQILVPKRMQSHPWVLRPI